MSEAPVKIPNAWEFYPCIVEDKPASILLNLWCREHYQTLENADEFYIGRITMDDPDEHGMGSEHEAEELFKAEDDISKKASKIGFYYVGRLRTDDMWQLVFYGPPEMHDTLFEVFDGATLGRSFEVESREDAEWSFYHHFLYPDDERQLWMQNRRQVQVLAEHGDAIMMEREVDHFLYFDTTEARGTFANALAPQGFDAYELLEPTEESGEQPFGIRVPRKDEVTVAHIHSVVMSLTTLAAESNGLYDGWGAPIVKVVMKDGEEPDFDDDTPMAEASSAIATTGDDDEVN